MSILSLISGGIFHENFWAVYSSRNSRPIWRFLSVSCDFLNLFTTTANSLYTSVFYVEKCSWISIKIVHKSYAFLLFFFKEFNIDIDFHQTIVFVLPISVHILPPIFWGEDFIFHNIIPVAISLTLNNRHAALNTYSL